MDNTSLKDHFESIKTANFIDYPQFTLVKLFMLLIVQTDSENTSFFGHVFRPPLTTFFFEVRFE